MTQRRDSFDGRFSEYAMTTIRVARRKKFTMVDRTTVNDERLSFRARGVLFWLLDKPDDWHTDSNAIARAGKEGRDAIRAALTELDACGYLARSKRQLDDGRWITEIFVHECPYSPTPENPSSVAGNRGLENRTSVNQALSSNTDIETDGSSLASPSSTDNDKPPDPTCIRCAGRGTLHGGAVERRCTCTFVVNPALELADIDTPAPRTSDDATPPPWIQHGISHQDWIAIGGKERN